MLGGMWLCLVPWAAQGVDATALRLRVLLFTAGSEASQTPSALDAFAPGASCQPQPRRAAGLNQTPPGFSSPELSLSPAWGAQEVPREGQMLGGPEISVLCVEREDLEKVGEESASFNRPAGRCDPAPAGPSSRGTAPPAIPLPCPRLDAAPRCSRDADVRINHRPRAPAPGLGSCGAEKLKKDGSRWEPDAGGGTGRCPLPCLVTADPPGAGGSARRTQLGRWSSPCLSFPIS
ncbi:uncharacterized protein LOC141936204 isoform X2 [Strix uralensis]|uniref:uncharacterized protein LOC141936204 isoform X2 n=1 Tax=Strix uralensis TaxID=36305 RepID=UPI003DA722D7